MKEKICSKCGQLKSIEDFDILKNNNDGHAGACKSCKKKYRNSHNKEEERRAYD